MKKIIKDALISFILTLILLTWISFLLWIDYNPNLTGKIIGFVFGLLTGTSVIVVMSIILSKKLKKEGQIIDERVRMIQQKTLTATLQLLYILFVLAGIIFTLLYYVGFDDGKVISYTFIYILLGMSLIKIPIYYYYKNKM